MATLTRNDQVRRIVVVLAEVFCVIGTLVGVGVLGTDVSQTSGGALSADATLIAPATTAFTIWTPIYIGLLVYTVWQFVPKNATTERVRSTGWLAAVSMVLNAAWLLVTQQGWIWVSVGVILALALTLGVLVQRLCREPAGSTFEKVVVDGTFGLYLGWVAVAACANVTAALVDGGVDLGSEANQAAAVTVVLVAAALGMVFTILLGGRWAVAAAMAWGLAWIAVGRLTDEPKSTATAVAAIVAAVIVLTAAGTYRRGGAVADTAASPRTNVTA
ncbi:MAG: tryptophan-rich sensory protein [Humibacillus sp.]|nr:tryptophan-rich sensory protein [Humibacillus sp.]MDN5780102.1 tryptophan-rich sensory protein [Humibacillus sp.]